MIVGAIRMPCIFYIQLILSTHNILSTDYCYVFMLFFDTFVG